MTAERFSELYMVWRNEHIDKGIPPEELTMAHYGAGITTLQEETIQRCLMWLENACKESPLITVVH